MHQQRAPQGGTAGIMHHAWMGQGPPPAPSLLPSQPVIRPGLHAPHSAAGTGPHWGPRPAPSAWYRGHARAGSWRYAPRPLEPIKPVLQAAPTIQSCPSCSQHCRRFTAKSTQAPSDLQLPARRHPFCPPSWPPAPASVCWRCAPSSPASPGYPAPPVVSRVCVMPAACEAHDAGPLAGVQHALLPLRACLGQAMEALCVQQPAPDQ